MNRKAVFFDADGTLCDMEKGVPQSTKEALKKLRENGKREHYEKPSVRRKKKSEAARKRKYN